MRLFLKICASPMSDIPSLFLCRPQRSEGGSPGTCVPWDNTVGGCRPAASAEGSLGACVPQDDIPKRRPERCEGCLANVRRHKVGEPFLKQPPIKFDKTFNRN